VLADLPVRLRPVDQHPPEPGVASIPVSTVDVDALDPAGAAHSGGSAAAVLRAVLDHGPVARAGIGQATGLSPAAVSRQTADLISLGLLRELPEAQRATPRAGRPHIPVDVDAARHLVCGVHIAVPLLTFGLVDLRGRVVASERVEHDGDPAAVLKLISRHLPDFVRRHGERRRSPAGRFARDDAHAAAPGQLLGVGVVSGGLVDARNGTILEHAPLGWRDVPVGASLRAATGLPVHVDGHARALAQAEILFGDPRARRSLVHLFAGHVVDAAIAMDGTVLRGQRSAAGGVAHLRIPGSTEPCPCGGTGCAEATLSERVWLARAAADGSIRRPDIHLLAETVAAREPAALELVRTRLRLTSRLIAMLIDMIDPEVVVLTELGTLQLPELIAQVHAEVAAHSRSCSAPEQVVRPTSFGSGVLAVAAAAGILGAVHRSPRSVRAPRETRMPLRCPPHGARPVRPVDAARPVSAAAVGG
jgi:predicted NBD/HSP70 family sugar kinase